MAFLTNIKITNIMPCIAKPGTIRFIAEFDSDISEVMPYLNTIMDNAIYSHTGHNITLKKDELLIGIHPRQLSAAKVADEKEAKQLTEWLKNLVNDTYEKRNSIKPDFERRKKLTALDIYKLLPATNCKKCGEATCLAFAVKISSEEKSIALCSDLFSGKYETKKGLVLELLKTCGYKIPSVFNKQSHTD